MYKVVKNRLELSMRPDGAQSSNQCCAECLKVCCCGACATMQVAEFLELYDDAHCLRAPDEKTPLVPPAQQVVHVDDKAAAAERAAAEEAERVAEADRGAAEARAVADH